MKLIFAIIPLIFCSFCSFGQSDFSRNDIIEDLETLKTVLEESHYDLYAYTAKKDFETLYDILKNGIEQDSLSLLETTNLFQELVSIINNGHTYIDFPIQPYIEYLQSAGTLFPLEITFENGKSYIRKNWSANSDIEIGSEILSINGKFIDELTSAMYPYISAERPYFKKAKIEFYSFPRYYWQVFGKQNVFNVKIKQEGEIKNYTLKSINAIEDFETKRTEIFHSERKVEFISNSAYLNPGAFSGDENKFRSFIDSAFVEINHKKSENVILDLRNNTGGNDYFSDYLVSYIADRPFKWNSSFTIKTSEVLKDATRRNNDTTKVYFKQILGHENGEIYEPQLDFYQAQESSKRFKGHVYVLVNRQSISQSAVTAAQIQDYDWGTIVGEETGEYLSLYASVFQYSLPNSGIVVNISKGHIIRVNGSKKQEGVIPDILIKDHLIDEEDEILIGLLERLDKNEKD